MKLEDLTAQFIKLGWDIRHLLSDSGFEAYQDLETLEDYEAATDNPEKLQLVNEYTGLLTKLDDVYHSIKYFSQPVQETGYLSRKMNGRYSLGDHEFISGCGIEYYCTDDDMHYDYDADRCKPYWQASRIEHNGSDYYIVGCKQDISEVQVRYRSR